jgi:hypothetical protein
MTKHDDLVERVLAQDNYLDRLRVLYEAGGRSALPLCLRVCMKFGLPIPDWAQKAYCESYDKVSRYQVKSWDDVFGNRLRKGRHFSRMRKKIEIAEPLVREVIRRHRANEKLDKEKIFTAVGKQFGVSATIASDIYYDAPKFVLKNIEAEMNKGNETSGKK